MALRRRQPGIVRYYFGKWPAMERGPVVESDAHRLLTDQMQAYLKGEVRGRSFLIAGHRGAGKTFLIRNAAERIYLELFKKEYKELLTPVSSAAGKGVRNPSLRDVQRPLFVQIHGPSLLGRRGEVAHGARHGDAKILAQIMVALYRALTTEYAESFMEQSRAAPLGMRRWLMRRAGRLQLALDMGVEPVELWGYWRWSLLGARGILWPERIGQARGVGQGAAEIVALATAAQAFQICAGTLKQEQSGRVGMSRATGMEVKSRDGLKEFLNKIYGLAAGGVAAAVLPGANILAHAAAGVAVAVGSTVALNFTLKSKTERERTASYKFLPDRSLETLDRDLPLVIARLRKAGLAPVFVIDELDKLAEHEDTVRQIGSMIEGLKLLTTDHGFFCFLTDRSYYERVQARALTRIYAKEHTNFSHTLLVQYDSRDFQRYIYRNLELDGASADEIREARIFAGEIIHKSELNFIQVKRLLDAAWDSGRPQCVAARFQAAQAESQLHAIVQLAIDDVWRHGALPARAVDDAHFAQVAADALYMISRRWRRDTYADLDLSADAIAGYLLERANGDRHGADEDAPAKTLRECDISQNDENVLVDAVHELAARLMDFRAFHARLNDPATMLPPEDEPMLKVFAAFVARAKGLLENAGNFNYRFLLDEYGAAITLHDGMRPGQAMTPKACSDVKGLLAYMDKFGAVLAEVGLDFYALREAGAISSLLPWYSVQELGTKLATALDRSKGYPGMTDDFETLARCKVEICNRASSLALSFGLGIAVTEQARTAEFDKPGNVTSFPAYCHIASLPRQLGRLWDSMAHEGDDVARAELLGELERLMPPLDSKKPILYSDFSSVAMMDSWLLGLKGWREANWNVRPEDRAKIVQRAWDRWYGRVLAHFTGGEATPPVFEDLLVAAAETLVGRLLRRELGLMNQLEWSELALQGAMTACGGGTAAPLWAMYAGLRALRMDARLAAEAVKRAAVTPHVSSPVGAETALLKGAEPAEAGILVIGKGRVLPAASVSPNIAGLYIDESDMERYASGLNWLKDAGLYDEVFDGR